MSETNEPSEVDKAADIIEKLGAVDQAIEILEEMNGHAVTLDQAKQAKCRTQRVRIEAFDGEVILQEMDGKRRDEYEDLTTKLKERNTIKGVMSNLIAMSWVDDDGKRVAKASDIDELPASAVSQMFQACIDLNGITEKDVEVLAKN